MAGKIKSIRIHPGIGIARLGDSDEFYIGPEAPGVVVDPGGSNGPGPNGGTYRDSGARLKRQAQRYRVYAYDAQHKVVAELTSDSDLVQSIRWRVHVRNMKAANFAFQGAYLFDPDKLRNPSIQPGMKPIERDKLIIDPGVHTIASGQAGPVTGVTISPLGSILRQENTGNTIFHSMQAKVEHRFANGFTVLASWLWSKGLGDIRGLNPEGAAPGGGAAGKPGGESKKKQDDVIDAEYEEGGN